MQAEALNAISCIFLTHLDLLDDLDEIKICTGYKKVTVKDDKQVTEEIRGRLPASIREYGLWQPQYETMKGWKCNTSGATKFSDLPPEAQSLIKKIEQKTKKEVSFVSTSSNLDEGMIRVRAP